jgi:hypothetical protein
LALARAVPGWRRAASGDAAIALAFSAAVVAVAWQARDPRTVRDR